MSFYTSLTGLNAATAELGIVSNNIANVGTTGFKKSRAEFGDIFATSPLQNASSSIGQGVLLKGVSQEFSQGNVAFSQNSLDMAIQGQGFFTLKPNLTSNQTVFTRNGSFRVNNDRYVVDSSGQFVQVFPVNDDGSVIATGLTSAKSLQLPQTAGLPRASSKIELGVNLPADAEILPQREVYKSGSAVYKFDRNDPNTYNKSTSITVFDSLGNPSIATIYYVKNSNATVEDPANKWQTYIFVGDREIKPALLGAKTDKSEQIYINEFGQTTTNPTAVDPTFNSNSPHPLYYQNDQNQRIDSRSGSFVGGYMAKDAGFDFGSTDSSTILLTGGSSIVSTKSGAYTTPSASAAGQTFSLTVDGVLVYTKTSAAADDKVFAADIDAEIASKVDQLKSAGIGYSGTVEEGTLTFHSLNESAFNVSVVNSFSGTTGGFAGSSYATGAANPIDGLEDGSGVLPRKNLFQISVDGSDYLSINLPKNLEGSELTGTQLATELTKAINNAFGDEEYFELDATNNKFRIFAQRENGDPVTISTPAGAASALQAGIEITIPLGSRYRPDDIVEEVQSQIDDAIGASVLTVSYDHRSRGLSFKPLNNDNDIEQFKVVGANVGGTEKANELFGFSATTDFVNVGAGVTQGSFKGGEMVPNGEAQLAEDQRRYGIEVRYLKDQRKFAFYSGTTGESSNISIRVPQETTEQPLDPNDSPTLVSANPRAVNLFGIGASYTQEIVESNGSGLPSTSAITTGAKAGIDVTGTFSVTANDNIISVTVDGIDGTVVIPSGAYTGATFAAAMQDRINLITTADGRSVSGVQVSFDPDQSKFAFTSGTTTTNSFINVNGHPNFGLDQTVQQRGEVPKVTVLKQATDADGNLLYIDKDGNETTQKPDSLPNWAPLYLKKGELTFDTAGKLVSPKEGAKYTPFDPQNGADLIVLNVDYGKFSTQYSQPFSVLSLSQDGYASGRLDGINIDAAGVVRANYTNGQQVALGKIILANFASPNGLKQIGNANYVATSNSGPPSVGEAGSDGFGSIQGGALERANVDLTEELVQLITAQRNFQANAKAIETATNLTSTIVNIR
jgi:flagellar hook-basal body protein